MLIKKYTVSLIIIFSLLTSSLLYNPVSNAQTITNRFSDVPVGHRLENEIHRLRDLNITAGVGNNSFGLGRIITRGEFVTYLVRLMGWEIVKPVQGSFADNLNPNHNFYGSIETALIHSVIKKDTLNFRIDQPITREEMAVMIVRALGYDNLASQLDSLGNPFEDVTRNFGYMIIVKDLGITAGTGPTKFAPDKNATREEAAAMMIRMYDKLKTPMSELHAFYAISSFSQKDKFSSLDSVSFGWARIEFNDSTKQVTINTDTTNNNEYYIPTGYSGVITDAQTNGISRQLMFFVKDQSIIDPETNKNVPLGEYIVTNASARKQAITAMVSMVNNTVKHGSSVSFDGLVSDFEGFKGEALKLSYNTFLTELKAELLKTEKKLYVAVHPKRKPGQEYFDGYDYKTIGQLADKVILMAHDYDATSLTDSEMLSMYNDTPVTPFDEVYYALKSITDPASGIQDKSKIWLQLSMDTSQWVQSKDTMIIINRDSLKPLYSDLYQRILKGVTLKYSEVMKNPYVIFNDESGNRNIVWYENQISIAEKIQLAKMFGIRGLSLWRLGNIPDYGEASDAQFQLNIWEEVINNYQ
jgi:spore germination protein YaaH